MHQLDWLGREAFVDYGLDDDAVSELRDRFADWRRHAEDDQEGQALHAASQMRSVAEESDPEGPAVL